jgi:hypothetical protein
MANNTKIGAALVGGYLLGRTKKAKLAFALGMLLAGKKLSLDPKQLGSLVTDSPLLSGLSDQVRRELVEATKSAATRAVTKRVGGLADALHDRTSLLERDEVPHEAEAEAGNGDGDRDRDRDRDGDRYADEDGHRGGTDRDDDEGRESGSRERGAGDDDGSRQRDAGGTSGRTSRSAKAAARHAARRSTVSAREASSDGRKSAARTRKTASGAGKTASDSVRRATGGGGHG